MGNRKGKAAHSVDKLVADMNHPLERDIQELRQVVRSASDGIGEEVKWNSPSFYTGEHFATLRLNGKVPIQPILHLGVRGGKIPVDTIQDPSGLLRWLGPDRACINFTESGDVHKRAGAVQAILRQWIQHVPARAAG